MFAEETVQKATTWTLLHPHSLPLDGPLDVMDRHSSVCNGGLKTVQTEETLGQRPWEQRPLSPRRSICHLTITARGRKRVLTATHCPKAMASFVPSFSWKSLIFSRQAPTMAHQSFESEENKKSTPTPANGPSIALSQ